MYESKLVEYAELLAKALPRPADEADQKETAATTPAPTDASLLPAEPAKPTPEEAEVHQETAAATTASTPTPAYNSRVGRSYSIADASRHHGLTPAWAPIEDPTPATSAPTPSPASTGDPFATIEQRAAAISAYPGGIKKLCDKASVDRSALNKWKLARHKKLSPKNSQSAKAERIEKELLKSTAPTV